MISVISFFFANLKWTTYWWFYLRGFISSWDLLSKNLREEKWQRIIQKSKYLYSVELYIITEEDYPFCISKFRHVVWSLLGLYAYWHIFCFHSRNRLIWLFFIQRFTLKSLHNSYWSCRWTLIGHFFASLFFIYSRCNAINLHVERCHSLSMKIFS